VASIVHQQDKCQILKDEDCIIRPFESLGSLFEDQVEYEVVCVPSFCSIFGTGWILGLLLYDSFC
jgi:hypothetical protein